MKIREAGRIIKDSGRKENIMEMKIEVKGVNSRGIVTATFGVNEQDDTYKAIKKALERANRLYSSDTIPNSEYKVFECITSVKVIID